MSAALASVIQQSTEGPCLRGSAAQRSCRVAGAVAVRFSLLFGGRILADLRSDVVRNHTELWLSVAVEDAENEFFETIGINLRRTPPVECVLGLHVGR